MSRRRQPPPLVTAPVGISVGIPAHPQLEPASEGLVITLDICYHS
jgi:hypothetical protein